MGDLNIYLIGPMGVGKSRVGPLVASDLGRPFLDLDTEIQRVTGMTIPALFEERGEAGFREVESRVLAQVHGQGGLVVSTGGGVILSPANRDLLSEGYVVWLTASLTELYQRLSEGRKDRPLLAVMDWQERLATLVGEREALYRQVAQLEISTDGRSPVDIAEMIVEGYNRVE